MGKLAPFGRLIHEMWEAGATDSQICDVLIMEHGLDITPGAIKQHRWRRRMRNPKRGGSPAFDASRLERLRRVREGLTYRQLAERFGVCRQTIWKHLK